MADLRKPKISRKGTLGASTSLRGFASIDEAKDAPREYLCPITLQLMRDPVLLVETGQVYDRESIESWFKSGHSTCPTSGVKVRNQRLSPIYPLRSAIQQFAKQHKIDLETVGESDEDDGKSGDSRAMDLGNLADCIGLPGVSLYDIEGLCKLMASNQTTEALSAMQLLADMARHGEKKQKKKILHHVSFEELKKMLKDGDPQFQVQAARLLLHLPGEEMTLVQMLQLLRYSNLQLREDVLLLLWQHGYRHRGRMNEIADAVNDTGTEEIVGYMKSLSDPTQNTDVTDEVRAYAAFVLTCISYRSKSRSFITGANVVPLLAHYLATTTDVGFRFCIVKGMQYLCEDRHARDLVQQAGAVTHFMSILPPLNPQILYTTRVFNDWFAWVTVAETAVKALFYLAKNERARQEMKSLGLTRTLREISRNATFSETAKGKYVGPLLGRLSGSQPWFVN